MNEERAPQMATKEWLLTSPASTGPDGAGPTEPALVVRRRVAADTDELVRIAEVVQERDGYPGRRPRDLRRFLVSDDALDAWVAECDGAIAGHVALHRESLPVVMEKAGEAVGRGDRELAVVARLIVDPVARGRGAGRALLETGAEAARARGLHPILDVVTHYDAANALYRSCGWHNLGVVEMVFRDGTTLHSYVYVAPT